MTQEQREAIWRLYTEKPLSGCNYPRAREHVLELLADLNIAIADRDHWKARAEALESDLINASMNLEIMTKRAEAFERAIAHGEHSFACSICSPWTGSCEGCYVDGRHEQFQFAIDRFSGEKEATTDE